jgi:hypothetical protein
MILLVVELAALTLWVVIPIYAFRQGRKQGIANRRMRRAGWWVFVLSILLAAANQKGPGAPGDAASIAGWATGFFLFVSVADALLLVSVAPRRAPK